MDSANEDNTTKDSKESVESVNEDNNNTKDSKESVKKETCLTDCEVEKSPEEHNAKKDVKDSSAEDEKKLDDSPIMGVMESKPRLVDAQDAKASESSIKKAIWERAAHIRANAEYVLYYFQVRFTFHSCIIIIPAPPHLHTVKTNSVSLIAT